MAIQNVASFVVYKANEGEYRHVADLEYRLDQNGQMDPDDLAEVQAYDQDADKVVYALNTAAMDNLYPLQFRSAKSLTAKDARNEAFYAGSLPEEFRKLAERVRQLAYTEMREGIDGDDENWETSVPSRVKRNYTM